MAEQRPTARDMFDLTGRVAVVAGGAGYLGNAVCMGLLQHGANVVVADINLTKAQILADELNGRGGVQRSLALPLDVGSADSIDNLVANVLSNFKRLDILVNATFAPQKKPIEEISADEFSDSLRINVTGSFLLARQARRVMTAGASIVMFSSMYGLVSPDPRIYHKPSTPNPIEYGAAKAGIGQMIRYLAVTWARDGIRVNGVAPGPFPQPSVFESEPDFVKRLAEKVPLGRVGNASEIAGAVVFLASDAASFVTGQCLQVDGGWTIW